MKYLLIAAFVPLMIIGSSGYDQLRRVKRIIGGTEAEKPPVYTGSQTTSTTTTTTPVPVQPTPRPIQPGDVQTRSAEVKGIQGNDGVNSFLGIRYAHPPTGRLRFQRPRRFKLRGEVDATRFGPPCPQWSLNFPGRIIGREDCLFLNIYSPQTPGSYPVLLWIHGGNFRAGSGAQYYPRDIVTKGLVVVTTNYRLGTLGYLSSGRKNMPGNVGLFDIASAGKWVEDYISYFGGDPNKIVLGGQGSGASAATLLALNRKSHSRKYRGILAMSGTPVSPFALDDNEIRSANDVSAESGCKLERGIEFVRCMQQLSLEQIMTSDKNVEDKRKNERDFPQGLTNLYGPGPRDEGKDDGRFLSHFLLQSPLEAIKSGQFPLDVPLMTGVTAQETGGGIQGNFLEEIKKKLLSPLFLQSGIFTKALEANTGLYVNKTIDPKLSALFLQANYLTSFSKALQGSLTDIQAIIKHTTNAFFNLPAFITSTLWSQKNKVFLYSFDHEPPKSPIGLLLPGVPLAPIPLTKTNEKKGAEHGDDLAYLFELRGLEGEALENNSSLSETDSKVKDHFTNAVFEFARSGAPKTLGSSEWKPFKFQTGDFMRFTEEPKMLKNFHKCDMGLWTGDYGLLTSTECSFLQASEIVKSTIGTVRSNYLTALNNFEGRIGLPGLTNSLLNPTSFYTARRPVNTLSPIVPIQNYTVPLIPLVPNEIQNSSLLIPPKSTLNLGGLFNPKRPNNPNSGSSSGRPGGLIGTGGFLG